MQRPFLTYAVITLCGLATILGWAWPNRPQAGDVTMPGAKFASVSYAPYRAWQSPLTKSFPDAAEVAQDLALVAKHAEGIRTYSALEGDYDIGALAKQAGLHVWLGIWLGSDLASNQREMAAGIAEANKHPHTITRVIVGNEVLLRRDLSVDALIADIDQVRAQVKQPVAYADVAKFWLEFPQVAPHVDVVMIHLLPYWENHPFNVDSAISHAAATIDQVKAKFPGKIIAVGETGWPSRGRQRQGAVASRVNEAIFIRKFVSLADKDHIDTNIIEAFDQIWKANDEGTAGANWGIWNAQRVLKFPLNGPVIEHPHWPDYVGIAIISGLALFAVGGMFSPGMALLAFALGNALAYAWAFTVPVIYDDYLWAGALINLPAQMILALFAMRRFAGGQRTQVSGAQTTQLVRSLLLWRVPRGFWRDWPGRAFDDLTFLFLWAAAVTQLMLAFDPRYRDAPLAVFAVPVVISGWRLLKRDFPGRGGWEEWVAGGALTACALVSFYIEGPLNHEFIIWNALALLLAAPYGAGILNNRVSPKSSVTN
ncbi:MAG: glycoside hydrolase [Rhodospirillales bacterium 20-60-12]|nr:MAG: glycoside hydrolase [Rhodospirillales bacterium 20-60-12]HQT67449.1 glycosyl hydrolase family 17 protein [Acetobacteraceae bacterium]